MNAKHLIWLIPLALSACGRGNEVDLKEASVSEVAEKMRSSGVVATSLKPGLWEATVKLDSIAAPGNPEVQQQLQANAGQERTITECLTAENAKKPFDRFVVGIGDDCRYEHFMMGGGRIDNKLVCGTTQNQRTIATQGTYDPDRYALKINSETIGGPISKTVMAMSLDARRTGDCPKTQGSSK